MEKPKKRKTIPVSAEVYEKLEEFARNLNMPYQDFIDQYLEHYIKTCHGVYKMERHE